MYKYSPNWNGGPARPNQLSRNRPFLLFPWQHQVSRGPKSFVKGISKCSHFPAGLIRRKSKPCSTMAGVHFNMGWFKSLYCHEQQSGNAVGKCQHPPISVHINENKSHRRNLVSLTEKHCRHKWWGVEWLCTWPWAQHALIRKCHSYDF